MRLFHSIDSAAYLLDKSSHQVSRMLQSGELNGIKLGGEWRIPDIELKRLEKEAIGEPDIGEPDHPERLEIEEAAELFEIDPEEIEEAIENDELPTFQDGSVPTQDLEALIESNYGEDDDDDDDEDYD